MHFLQTNTVAAVCRLSFTPLHHLCTHLLQLVHLIELSPSSVPHTPHKLVPNSSIVFTSSITSSKMFPTLISRPIASILFFHLSSLCFNFTLLSAIKTRSSAYRSFYNRPYRASLETTSITIINSNSLGPDAIRLSLQNCHYHHPKSKPHSKPDHYCRRQPILHTPFSSRPSLYLSEHHFEGLFQVNECIILYAFLCQDAFPVSAWLWILHPLSHSSCESKLHFIHLHLLADLVCKNSLNHFHCLFQEFNHLITQPKTILYELV